MKDINKNFPFFYGVCNKGCASLGTSFVGGWGWNDPGIRVGLTCVFGSDPSVNFHLTKRVQTHRDSSSIDSRSTIVCNNRNPLGLRSSGTGSSCWHGCHWPNNSTHRTGYNQSGTLRRSRGLHEHLSVVCLLRYTGKEKVGTKSCGRRGDYTSWIGFPMRATITGGGSTSSYSCWVSTTTWRSCRTGLGYGRAGSSPSAPSCRTGPRYSFYR